MAKLKAFQWLPYALSTWGVYFLGNKLVKSFILNFRVISNEDIVVE